MQRVLDLAARIERDPSHARRLLEEFAQRWTFPLMDSNDNATFFFWDGEPAGFALWFYNFSTFAGKAGIYLEDLFVEPQFRGHGIGKALLKRLARRCVAEGLPRLQWWVLDWNEPSIAVYRALGAKPMDEWTVYRVSGAELAALAS